MTRKTSDTFGKDYFGTTYPVDGLKRFSQHWWSVRFYAGLAHHCMKGIGGSRLLEVGCGFGFILAALERRYETFGVDVSEYAIEQCRRLAPKSHCVVADVEASLPEHLEPSSFDLVLARYVFEHLGDPAAAMTRLVDVLRPGGVLLYSVPNTESIGARWKGRDWYAHQDPTHCSLLSPAQWLEVTRRAGAVVRRETSDGYWDVPYVKWLPTWFQKPIFLPTSAVACLVGRAILPARFGENVVVIAEKNRPAPRDQESLA